MSIYPPYSGGAEIHAYYVSNNLTKAGNYVHLISAEPKERGAHDAESLFQKSLVRLWQPPFHNMAYVLKVSLLAYLRRNEFDVMQVHIASTAMMPAFLVSKITGKPYIVTCHGSDIRIFRKKILMGLLQKILLLKASHVVAVSKEIASLLIREYGLPSQNVTLIPNGYDEVLVEELLSRCSESVRQRSSSLVFVGSLREAKDPLNLIEVFKIVSDRFASAHLQIVGDGNLRSAVVRRIRQYELQDRITLLGMVPHQRALEIMASANIYISTSIDEGLPTSLIEAMALEKAIVTTDVGGVPEIVINGVNGLLTPPRVPERMARLIGSLLKDPVLAGRLGKAAAESVRDFSWNCIAQRYRRMYQEIHR